MKYGFCLPLKDGKPLKVSTPATAGVYITKYLTKEHKEWHHRMKATRNLGMEKLRTILRIVNEPILEALTWRAERSSTNTSAMKTHTVPLGLVRSEAKRQSFFRKFRQNRLDLKDLLAPNYGVFLKMLSSVRAGERPDRMDSSEFFDWVAKHLPDQKGYSETRLLVAHTLLGTVFPSVKTFIDHVKMGANNSGFT